MTHSTMAALLGPEFDAFLFAPVDEENNGVLLSVLSALARLNVDPWLEAVELARMPREAATQRLTSLIASLPGSPVTGSAPATIADRLVRLLPRRDANSVATRENLLRPHPTPNFRTIVATSLISLVVIVGMVCAQWALSSHQQPERVGTVHPSVSDTAFRQTPQLGLGR